MDATLNVLGAQLNKGEANDLFALTLTPGWLVLMKVFAEHKRQLEHEVFVDVGKSDLHHQKIGRVEMMNTIHGLRKLVDDEIRKLG